MTHRLAHLFRRDRPARQPWPTRAALPTGSGPAPPAPGGMARRGRYDGHRGMGAGEPVQGVRRWLGCWSCASDPAGRSASPDDRSGGGTSEMKPTIESAHSFGCTHRMTTVPLGEHEVTQLKPGSYGLPGPAVVMNRWVLAVPVPRPRRRGFTRVTRPSQWPSVRAARRIIVDYPDPGDVLVVGAQQPDTVDGDALAQRANGDVGVDQWVHRSSRRLRPPPRHPGTPVLGHQHHRVHRAGPRPGRQPGHHRGVEPVDLPPAGGEPFVQRYVAGAQDVVAPPQPAGDRQNRGHNQPTGAGEDVGDPVLPGDSRSCSAVQPRLRSGSGSRAARRSRAICRPRSTSTALGRYRARTATAAPHPAATPSSGPAPPVANSATATAASAPATRSRQSQTAGDRPARRSARSRALACTSDTAGPRSAPSRLLR